MMLRASAVIAAILSAAVAVDSAVAQSCTAPPQARIFIAYLGPVSNCTPASGTCNVGESIAFDAQAFQYAFQQCDTFTWHFGDGSTRTGRTVAHTYQAAGTYTAILRVTNSAGGATAEVQVRVGADRKSTRL